MGTHAFKDMPRVLDKIARGVESGAQRVVKRAATTIDTHVVEGTPVDRGVARSNWVGTVDLPFIGIIPAYVPGDKLGRGERANASAAKRQARFAIARFSIKKNSSIFLANNVSYIGQLNRGSSAQSFPLFVEKSIIAGQAAIANMKLLTPRRSGKK